MGLPGSAGPRVNIIIIWLTLSTNSAGGERSKVNRSSCESNVFLFVFSQGPPGVYKGEELVSLTTDNVYLQQFQQNGVPPRQNKSTCSMLNMLQLYSAAINTENMADM